MRFEEKHTEEQDIILIAKSLDGDRASLEALVGKHQNFIYNAALNMLSDPEAAADATQEVLIKMLASLADFQNRSSFRTWLYRIVKNTFLNMRRGSYELANYTFSDFAAGLKGTADEKLEDTSYATDHALLAEEARLSCMKGMLLCLDREQRFIYIIGELLEFSDSIASEVMGISRENFRVRLHRARTQLYGFMDSRCGLINKSNPCRCARKTAGFIKAGYVDPQRLHFQKNRIDSIENAVREKLDNFENAITSDYQKLFASHPFVKGPDALQAVRDLLASERLIRTFNLDE